MVLAAQAAAEPVQTSFTADANTTGLWLFKEGTGTSSACEVPGAPAATLNGASWVMGRQYYAVATDSGYVAIPDGPAVRPAKAFTAEVWVKLQRPGGYVLCKNGSYLLTVDSTVSASFGVGKGWQAVNGVLPVPIGQWTHIAITYDSATTQAAIYVNGALDRKSALAGGGGLVGYGSQLQLGLNDWNPMGSEMDGKIDSLRISNVARTFEPIPHPAREAAVEKGNLVPNGDFELGLTGWRMTGEGDANLVWGTDAKDPASGRLCLHSIPGSEGGETLLSRPIPVRPGGHYTFSARIRADVRSWPRIEIVSAGASGDFASVPPFPVYPAVDTKWVEAKQPFVIPNDFAAPLVCILLPFPSPGEIWVDDVRLTAGDTAGELALKDKIAVGPQTLPVGNLYPYTAGSTTPMALNVVNTDAAAHKVTVQAIATDCEGQPLPAVAVGTFDVPAGGVKTATFGLNTGRRGTFRLGFDLACDGQTWRQSAECKYAVVVPLKGVGNAEDSAFGMNTHMEREATPHLSRSMEVLSQCGVKWIRAWWSWGMCEKTQGTFDFTEFDRQFSTVTGAGMRIMPILLRYYSQFEQKWAGPVTPGAIQEYPDPKVLPEWKIFSGKVAERYKGRITAYELWNEPTMGSSPNGVLTPQQYADLLENTTPAIRQYDPKAKIVGFAGVPTDYLESTLKLGVAPLMDVVSEHSYSQLALPETSLPKRTKEVRAILAANGGDKPLWHTEQGLVGDDDGYSPMTLPEADVASLYTRNFVLVRSLGIEKYFWFSAQTSPAYGMAVFYEDYIPRARLAALNACASFLEGSSCRGSYRPSENAYAFLFEGTAPVGVVWNLNTSARVSLAMPPDAVQAFDMMGNALPVVAEKDTAVIQVPAERPVFLRCDAEHSALLKRAVAGMQVKDMDPVVIKAGPVAGGVQVTLTGASPSPVDGVLDLIPAGSKTPTDWPAAQHFQSLASGQSQEFRFTLPSGAAVSQVRVVCGNRRLQTATAPYTGR
jgi:hypothetical protein